MSHVLTFVPFVCQFLTHLSPDFQPICMPIFSSFVRRFLIHLYADFQPICTPIFSLFVRQFSAHLYVDFQLIYPPIFDPFVCHFSAYFLIKLSQLTLQFLIKIHSISLCQFFNLKSSIHQISIRSCVFF